MLHAVANCHLARATWSPHSGHVFHIGYKPLTAAIGQTDTAAAAEIASH